MCRQRRDHVVHRIGTIDQRQHAIRAQQPARGKHPGEQQIAIAQMRRAPPRIGRMRRLRRIVKMADSSQRNRRTRPQVLMPPTPPPARLTSRQIAVALSANPLRSMLRTASAASDRVDLYQRQPNAGHARCDCKAGRANTGAQFDDVIARLRRCRRSQQRSRRGRSDGPCAGCSRRRRPPSAALSVICSASSGDIRPQLVAQPGVVQQPPWQKLHRRPRQECGTPECRPSPQARSCCGRAPRDEFPRRRAERPPPTPKPGCSS